MIKQWVNGFIACSLICLTASTSYGGDGDAKNEAKKEKLKIILLFGQSNMVGMPDVRTAWYLTQPQWEPPRDVVVKKSEYFDWNSYQTPCRNIQLYCRNL